MHGSRDDAVLVPGVTAPSSVSCLRSLNPRGVRTIVGSESPTTPAAASRHCDAFVQVPDPGASLSAYGDALLSVARREDVTTIIPVREEDVHVLAANRDAFAEIVETPWPDMETLGRVQDRVKLFEAAEEAGIETPKTAPLTEWDDWSDETIIKPRYTLASPEFLGPDADLSDIGTTVYNEPGKRPSAAGYRDRWGHVPLVQEYLSDPREFGFFALYDHGEPVATFQHCQQRGYKYCGGPSSYRESVDIPALETAGRSLLDELEWHGLAMVEFLRDPETGAFKLMEINPRFWSSLPFTVRAGVDFPRYYWELATDQPISFSGEYDVGIGGHLLRGELCHLHSILTEEYPLVERPSFAGALRDVATSLARNPRFDYATIDDPVPFIQDGLNSLRASAEGQPLPSVGSRPSPKQQPEP
ncbi:carboxylate--amine ligase [Halobacteria archaeon AArc-dxtr1]|nr:carboxylate--amine ligase [Halobacteria archaeon AArc-dxtr1]